MNVTDFDLSDPDAAAFCPACGAGYTAGRSRCEDCDRELLPRSEIEAALAQTESNPYRPPGHAEPPRALEPAPDEPIGAALELKLSDPEFDLSDPDAVAFCPRCGSGYRAGPLVCVDCQTELRPRSWVETRPEPASDPSVDEVVLADVENPFRADVLRSALHDQGVWFAEQPTGWSALRFVVRPIDLELARELLADIDESAE